MDPWKRFRLYLCLAGMLAVLGAGGWAKFVLDYPLRVADPFAVNDPFSPDPYRSHDPLNELRFQWPSPADPFGGPAQPTAWPF